MYYVLHFNPSDPNQDPWPGAYGQKPDSLPDGQVECTQEQHDAPYDYHVIDGLIIEKLDSEKLVRLKGAAITALKKKCMEILEGGFTSVALGKLYTYPTSLLDQTNLQTAIMLAGAAIAKGDESWYTQIQCTDENGVKAYVSHNATSTLIVGNDMNTFILKGRTRYADLVAQVESADTDTIEKLQAIVW